MSFSGKHLRAGSIALSVLALALFAGCGDDDSGTNPEPTNHAPVISSVLVNPPSCGAGASATVTVVASDADSDPLTYSYTPNGGAITGSGSSVMWIAPSQAGTFSVSVAVSDGKASPVTSSGTLTVAAAQTGIRGTITAPPGPQVDLRNMMVRLYSSYGDYLADAPAQFIAAQGNEYSVTFTFTNIPPGSTYYLDAWKDMDSDGNYTAGDIWSVYATGAWPNQTVAAIIVTQGNMTDVSTGLVTFIL